VTGRWVLPDRPRAAVYAGLAVYQPVTLRALAGWEVARLAAAAGCFRLLGSDWGPAPTALSALAGQLRPDELVAVSTGTAAQRWVALILNRNGHPRALAKIAGLEQGRRTLLGEVEALRRLAPLLSAPLTAPALLDVGDGIVLYEALSWRPRLRPWRLPQRIAAALGHFFRARSIWREGRLLGPVHGDFAPWNVLQTSRGWALVDWEDADETGPAFYDLFHYLVQAHLLLGRPTRRTLLAGVRHQRGWVGDSVMAYAQAARLDHADLPAQFESYLVLSAERQANTPEGALGRAGRERLLATLRATGPMR
jgi:hypothetical protein